MTKRDGRHGCGAKMNRSIIASIFTIYLAVGLGKNASFTNQAHEWVDHGRTGITLELGYRKKLSDRFTAGVRYIHVSQPLIGPPINDMDESSLDHFGIYGEYILWK